MAKKKPALDPAAVLAVLERVEWTCDDPNDTDGAAFCPECGAHAKDCQCDDWDGYDMPEWKRAHRRAGSHAQGCTLGALVARCRRLVKKAERPPLNIPTYAHTRADGTVVRVTIPPKED